MEEGEAPVVVQVVVQVQLEVQVLRGGPGQRGFAKEFVRACLLYSRWSECSRCQDGVDRVREGPRKKST